VPTADALAAGGYVITGEKKRRLPPMPGDAGVMTGRQALELATRDGAAVLGRDDIGYLAPGMSADFIAINLNQVAFAGALHDPVAAVLFCQTKGVDWSVINGRVVVENGRLTTLDMAPILRRHNEISRAMVRSESA
jgi:cytosine/adenosine deaminase-related metal-dependent hydrolase